MLTRDAPPWVTKGSGMAGDGHDPEDHPDIDDELEEDHRCDAGGEQRAKTRRVIASRPTSTRHSSRMNRTNRTIAPDEPELFGKRREHEVGGLDGQEIALRLGCHSGVLCRKKPPEPTAIWAW